MGEKARGKDKGKKTKTVETAAIGGAVTKAGAKALKAGKLTSTLVKLCPNKCVSGFQDKKYGPGVRVFNPAKKGTMCACTVCGRETGLS